MISTKKKQPDGKFYLIDQRLQNFMNIDDATIQKRLHLMSLSDFGGMASGGVFGQDKPVSKVYTTLNIIDGYQQKKKEQNYSLIQYEEMKEEEGAAVNADAGLLDNSSFVSNKYVVNESNPLSPIRPFNSFSIKAVEYGKTKTKFDMEFRSNVWIISKNQDLMDQYLESIGIGILSHLNTEDGVNPRFTTLLFLDFFKKVDQMSADDIFRELHLTIEEIEVIGTSLRIDSKTGKTVIDLDFGFTFGQILSESEGSSSKVQ